MMCRTLISSMLLVVCLVYAQPGEAELSNTVRLDPPGASGDPDDPYGDPDSPYGDPEDPYRSLGDSREEVLSDTRPIELIEYLVGLWWLFGVD